jgi:biopolymer transport protein ExbD
MENLPKKVRSKKLSTKVDLTAMVSVSFLLIIFFMVVGELSKPKIMDLCLPEKDPDLTGVITCGKGVEERLITILLDENNKIVIYRGLLGYDSHEIKKVEYGKNGIRTELFKKNKQIIEYSASMGRTNRGAVVIIKPSKKCNFKNLVDILDEMAIAGIETYAIVNEFTPEESNLLALN